jgi:hypothetical protein
MIELLVMRLAPVDRPMPNQLKQAVFFINNYNLVVSLFQDKNMQEKEEAKHFHDLQKIQISRFVEDELLIYFNGLVTFVKQTSLLGLEDALRLRNDSKDSQSSSSSSSSSSSLSLSLNYKLNQGKTKSCPRECDPLCYYIYI